MDFGFNMPVKLKFGTGVVKRNREDFRIGKKALIVTGRSSGRLSGALDDITGVLLDLDIGYAIFNEVENNPTLSNVLAGTSLCKSAGADFIIAIGGGSPMDAAKGIAALATNDIEPIELLKNDFKNPFLPIIAIPTTSGTGSEVTPYSVLTIPSLRTKRSFASQWAFPVAAFADPSYTNSLPYGITVDTAFDAFSHLLESYCSKRSTVFNDSIALEGIRVFAECMEDLRAGEITGTIREKLMYASCLGGIAITHTGTTLMHAMGYSLTYFKGISHGRANAMLMTDYFKLNEKAVSQKIHRVMDLMGFHNFESVDKYFNTGYDGLLVLSEEECRNFASLAYSQGSVKQTAAAVTEEDIYKIYKKKFGGDR